MNPAGALVRVPNLSILALAPQADPAGIVDKLIIDATTPVAPDTRGNYGNQVHDLPEPGEWITRLQDLITAQ
jgi:3-polyprenyl-4-hydroxybenzoate decarboxylase